MEPLLVTAHVGGSPLALDSYVTLDGILAYAALRDTYGGAFYDLPDPRQQLLEPDLPLLRCGAGADWYWAASSGLLDIQARGTTHWHKRLDSAEAAQYVDFGKRRGVFITAEGPYRAYRMPVEYLLTETIRWYATGDAPEVHRLLHTYVTHLGKKSSQGFGRVWRWTVAPTSTDGAIWCDGMLMRPVPGSALLRKGAIYDLTRWGCRPPYWAATQQRMCVLPGARHAPD